MAVPISSPLPPPPSQAERAWFERRVSIGGTGASARTLAGAESEYAAGRPDRAERLLRDHLANLLEEVRKGHGLPEPSLRDAIRLSLRLAAKTSRGAWFDHAMELMLLTRYRPGEEIIPELLDRGGSLEVDRVLLTRFVRVLGGEEAGCAVPAIQRLAVLSGTASSDPIQVDPPSRGDEIRLAQHK
ncbi:MAG: hypothetical protein JW751_08970 [Polyangiaceae bacterium]|nr:hypothetical protein [Polyangiaceae bacterium]